MDENDSPLAAVWANNPSRTENVLSRLPGLFAAWEDFSESDTPVRQADALLAFSNELTHLRWAYDGDLDGGDGE